MKYIIEVVGGVEYQYGWQRNLEAWIGNRDKQIVIPDNDYVTLRYEFLVNDNNPGMQYKYRTSYFNMQHCFSEAFAHPSITPNDKVIRYLDPNIYKDCHHDKLILMILNHCYLILKLFNPADVVAFHYSSDYL